MLGWVAAVVGVPIAVLLLGEDPLPGLAPAAVLIATGILFVARGGASVATVEDRSLEKGGATCPMTV